MKQKLILLSGKKQSGKSTFAEFFEEEGYLTFAIAEELKYRLCEFIKVTLDTKIDESIFYDNDLKDKPLGIKFVGIFDRQEGDLTVRKAMQWYGEMIRFHFGQSFWINALCNTLEDITEDNIVISDCRFQFEIDELTKRFKDIYDIHTVRIIRPISNDDTDKSEIAMDELEMTNFFDFKILNDGTLDDLQNKFDNIFKYINE